MDGALDPRSALLLRNGFQELPQKTSNLFRFPWPYLAWALTTHKPFLTVEWRELQHIDWYYFTQAVVWTVYLEKTLLPHTSFKSLHFCQRGDLLSIPGSIQMMSFSQTFHSPKWSLNLRRFSVFLLPGILSQRTLKLTSHNWKWASGNRSLR